LTLELINPEDLPTPPTYTHVVVATGSRLVFVAGQEPEDEQGNLVGAGDLRWTPLSSGRLGLLLLGWVTVVLGPGGRRDGNDNWSL
jgi:hypothetical protein